MIRSVNILGEYGSKQYRFNGTLGFLLTANTFVKITAEQLAQRLPFLFTTGNVEAQVKQNAIGARLQRDFSFGNLSLGAYAANSPNKRLNSLAFVSNGFNCNGFESGLTCVNERNIAGADTSGGDVGLGAYVNRDTYIEGKFYYDNVHYNTIFSNHSRYNASGYGGGVYLQHLLAANLKLTAGAEARKIYDTYNLALSWMPRLTHAAGTEISVLAEHVNSHNQTPNNNILGFKVTFFADRVNYQAPLYGLNQMPVVDNIASWISQPAVKMNQVLAISEEYIHLASIIMTSISPNFGPLAGGNVVTIYGSNFPNGMLVRFGANIAMINTTSLNAVTVIVPHGDRLGAVPVSLTTPDGQTSTFENAYLYTNGIAPIITGASIAVGPVAGGTQVTINGANFVAGETIVTIGGIVIPASAVTVTSPTSLTFTTPPHPAGTVLVNVATSAGPSGYLPGGFTFVDAPTASSITPTSGSPSGGTLVTINGSNFVMGNTSVTIGGVVIPASAVVVDSSSTLSFTTPAHAAGTVDVSITTPGGSTIVPGGFVYSALAATVSSISPLYGPSAGGTVVTVNGTNFEVGTTSVTIGDIVIPAASVTVNSATSLSFTTPAHAQGNVAVNVNTSVGSSGFVPGGFNYVDVPTASVLNPNSGPVAGGTQVTINGSNFVSGNTSVIIGSTTVPANVASATSLTFVTPAGTGNVAVTVVTPGGTSNPVPGGFSYLVAPTATSINPTFGSTLGGTVVTLSGSDFVINNTSVTIGNVSVPANVTSSTSLNFTTPAGAAGNVAVTVTTPGGTSSPVPNGFDYFAVPTATSLSQTFGPSAGGTVVTITGSNFVVGNTTVTIGSTTVPATVTSSTSLNFTTPGDVPGNVGVTVTTPGGTSAPVPNGFNYVAAPLASSLSPASGPTAGGTVVTISGTNFVVGNTSVTIGGTTVPASVASSTSLSFTTPSGTGLVSVTVTTPGGSSAPVPGGFNYIPVPTATSLSPAAGPSGGGTVVTLTGSNFVAGNTSVTIGSTTVAAAVTSSTSLSFTTPVGAAGLVAVTVTTPGGVSSAVPGGFTYFDAPTATALSPSSGPDSGGTTVTVTGSNFVMGNTSVIIGGTVVAATVISPTSLNFITPAGTGNVAVMVATSGGTSSAVPNGFTYLPVPGAISLNPASGPVSGGTVVTVSGSNFVVGNTSVTIGGNTVPATVTASDTLSFTTPAGTGNANVSVTTAGGTSSPNLVFAYVASPTATSLSPAFGPDTGGTTVTVTGSGFVVGNTTVTIGSSTVPATVATPTSLTFTTPAGSGVVAVMVTTPGGTTSAIPNGFTYVPAPTATALSPVSGSISGGTTVTVTGSGFVSGNTVVTIDGVDVPANVTSANTLSFNTPAHAAGGVNVTVTTPGGISSPALVFTYLDAPVATSLSPVFGPVAGGTSVTVTGSNFVEGNTSISIDGVTVSATVAPGSSTSLTFTTPAHIAGLVAVTVTTPNGTSSPVPGGFRYEAVPVITALSPTSGSLAGSTAVTVTGSNFVVGNTSVTIGVTTIPAASVTVNSTTSLTFSTPAGTGVVGVTVSNDVGTSNSLNYTYTNTAPTATSLAPAFGSIAGGTVVTVTGSNFVIGNTNVSIGGNTVPATVSTASTLTFTTPAHAAGIVDVTVITVDGTSSPVPGGFSYEATPTITSLSPTSGSLAGSTLVTVTGSNFVVGNTSVTIGVTTIPAASVTVNSPTSLTFTTPAGVGTVGVTVSNNVGTSNSLNYSYTNTAPTATSLNPISGPVSGGTVVTVTGSNFVIGNTTVTIGGNSLPATVSSTTSLSFTTPANAAGTVDVTVTTANGTSGPVPGGFTYLDAPATTSLSPLSGPVAGGTLVTVTGSNFVAGNTNVTIGGSTVSATVASPTSLSFTTPAGAVGSANVTVTTPGGTSSPALVFTYVDVPTATSLSPSFGPIAGGTAVTITGSNFVVGNTTVTIGGNTISATVGSSTSLSFTTPANAAGPVAVMVTTVGGTTSPSLVFTYVAPPTTASLNPISGPTAGGTLVTVTGSNFVSGNTSVTIGGNTVSATVVSPTSLSFTTPAGVAGSANVTVTTPGGTSSPALTFTYVAAPTATSLNPSFGPIVGGTAVTVTGSNFVVGNTTVTIGGNTVSATVGSSTSLSFTTPANAAGTVAVTVTTAGGTTSPSLLFTYVALPTAASLSPISGPAAGGTLVTVTGSNFVAGNTNVTIGGSTVSATVASPTSLSFTTPAGAAGSANVTVTTPGGTSSPALVFTYVDVPTATSLSPSFGPIAGGTAVTITGSNFVVGNTTVTIGGNTISATVGSSTSLSFTTPANAAGTVAVTVNTAGGTTSPSLLFTYVASPTATSLSPISGPTAGGTLVTVTGSNFVSGNTSVTIGSNTVSATVASSTSLSFTTPAGVVAGSVNVTVTTPGGTSSPALTFTYVDMPTATSLSPSFGSTAGGTLVTITGSNFVTGSTNVTIGGNTVAANVGSSTSLSFTTPSGAAGPVAVSVTTAGGTTTPSLTFTYMAIPTTSSLSPTSGPISGGTTVTVTGSGFVVGNTSVTIGGTSVSATVGSASSLTFTAPAHAAGNVNVTVTTPGGTSTPAQVYTYLAAPTAASINPTSGTTAGDTVATITGSNFVAGSTSVTIGGTTVPASSVTVNSSSALTFSTPAHAAGNVSVNLTTPGGTSNNISGGYTYLAPSLSSCKAPIPSALGVQLLTCVGANLTLFQTTFLRASGSAACSTFPTETILPTINILGNVLITATDIPSLLTLGLIGCKVEVCSDSACSILGGVAGPVTVTFGL